MPVYTYQQFNFISPFYLHLFTAWFSFKNTLNITHEYYLNIIWRVTFTFTFEKMTPCKYDIRNVQSVFDQSKSICINHDIPCRNLILFFVIYTKTFSKNNNQHWLPFHENVLGHFYYWRRESNQIHLHWALLFSFNACPASN